MSQMGRTDEMCAFCMLVIQVGYDHLSAEDAEKVAAHMKVAHRLHRFSIPR